MPIDYLQKILTAKVYDVAIETPLDLAPTLSHRLGNRVLLKGTGPTGPTAASSARSTR